MLQGRRTDQQSTGIDSKSRYRNVEVPSWVTSTFTSKERLVDHIRYLSHCRTVERKAKDKARNKLYTAKKREIRLVEGSLSLLNLIEGHFPEVAETMEYQDLVVLVNTSLRALGKADDHDNDE